MNLANLDPNAAIAALTLLSSLAGWAWAKARGERTADLKSIVAETVDAELGFVLLEGAYGTKARAMLTTAALATLAELQVPTQVARRLALYAVERGMVALTRELAARRIPVQAAALAAGAQGVKEAWAAAEARGKANSPFAGVTVEKQE